MKWNDIYWILQTFFNKSKTEKLGVQSYSAPLSQYFVVPPFAAFTAVSHLGYVSISFAHRETDIFSHSSLQNSSSSVSWMESICEQQFSLLSTDSRLDSGLDFDLAILTPGYVYF